MMVFEVMFVLRRPVKKSFYCRNEQKSLSWANKFKDLDVKQGISFFFSNESRFLFESFNEASIEC